VLRCRLPLYVIDRRSSALVLGHGKLCARADFAVVRLSLALSGKLSFCYFRADVLVVNENALAIFNPGV